MQLPTDVTAVRREQAVIDVFEQSTRSVVNVFDVTLQVRTQSKLAVLSIDHEGLAAGILQ